MLHTVPNYTLYTATVRYNRLKMGLNLCLDLKSIIDLNQSSIPLEHSRQQFVQNSHESGKM